MSKVVKTLSDRILQDARVRAANVVAAFYPMKGEPDILPVLQVLSKEGRLLLPRCSDDGTIDFFKVNNLYLELQEGHYGIKEPVESCNLWVGKIPVFLVPGVKFSADGGRKGHGMGYYDKFLAKYPNSLKFGVCLPEQLQEEPLELQEHDIKMDEIFSA